MSLLICYTRLLTPSVARSTLIFVKNFDNDAEVLIRQVDEFKDKISFRSYP